MLIGHKQQWIFLKQAFINNRLPQAFIFSGEERIGKKKIAFEFAKMILCENKEKAPCQVCQNCTLVEKNFHPDFIFISSEKKEIQIDQIRNLQKNISLTPVLCLQKIIVINNAHCLNIQAQNCLLKTLEEPKNKAMFILISSMASVLLPTIRSRCATLKFYPLKEEEIKNSIKIPEDFLLHSLGKPGMAVDFLTNQSNFLDFQNCLNVAKKFLTGNLLDRLLFIKNLYSKIKDDETKEGDKKREDCLFFLESIMWHLRKSLWQRANDKSKENALLKTKKAIELTQEAIGLLQTTNVSPRLLLENLILNF